MAGTDILPGDIDGDDDFDANDSFLIHLSMLGATESQIDEFKGNSPLTPSQVNANIREIGAAGDVDGDSDFDANDSFLIHITKLSGTNDQIDAGKGSSVLTVPHIRSNINSLADRVAAPIFTLRESNGFLTTETYPVDLGVAAGGTRTIRVEVDAAFDTTDFGPSVEDLFQVYLFDTADPTKTLLDRGENGTSLLTLSGSKREFLPGFVRFDGQAMEIDVSQVTGVTTGNLVFHLINSDRDRDTRVDIRSITNTVDLVGTSAPIIPPSRATLVPPAAKVDTSNYQEAPEVEVLIDNVRLQESSGVYRGELRLQNNGEATGRQLLVVFEELPQGVTLSNRSGIDNSNSPYLNVVDAIPGGGLLAGSYSDFVPIEFTNPDLTAFSIIPKILTLGPNKLPQFATIGNLEVMPGETLEVDLFASDPDGDQITFGIQMGTGLPPGELQNDGRVTFRPGAADVGDYEFHVAASDGAATVVQTVSLEVVADPMTTTRYAGKILNTNDEPLAALQLTIGSQQAVTDQNGEFIFETATAFDSESIEIHGDIFADGVYPYLKKQLSFFLGRELVEGMLNEVHRVIYMPTLDVDATIPIQTAGTTVVTNDQIPGAKLVIPAGTAMDANGQPLNGNIGIMEVPLDRTPRDIPLHLIPDTVYAIYTTDTNGVEFSVPAQFTVPNKAGYSPGAILDLWEVDPATEEFQVLGHGVVSSDGMLIEATDGGVVSGIGGNAGANWRFVAPPPPEAQSDDGNEDNRCDECKVRKGNFEVELHSGTVLEDHDLVTYQSISQTQGFGLHYDSLRADPRPIVHINYANLLPNENQRLVARLEFMNGDFKHSVPGYQGTLGGLQGSEHFWQIDVTGTGRAAMQTDFTMLPSGIYEYSLTSGPLQFDGETFSGTTTTQTGELLIINARNSPFGAGWGLTGLWEIIENSDGSALMFEGGGSELYFEAATEEETLLSPPGDFSQLVKLPNGTYRRTMANQTVYQFNASHKLESITDRNDNVWQYEYTTEGIIRSIADPTGLTTVFESDNGRITSITDPANRLTILQYDSNGNLIRVVDPDNSTSRWNYDNSHRITSHIDKRGFLESVSYGFAGRAEHSTRKDGSEQAYDPAQTQVLRPSAETTDPFDSPSIFHVDEIIGRYMDANGNVTETLLDKQGQGIQSNDPEGNKGGVIRNEMNLVTDSMDARGFTTSFAYDDRGNVLTMTDDTIVGPAAGGTLFHNELIPLANGTTYVETRDHDGDGVLDLRTYPARRFDLSGASFVLLGNGDGTFQSAEQIPNGNDPRVTVTADFNGDGASDSAYIGGNAIFITMEVSGETRSLSVGDRPVYLISADLNGDSQVDLVSANADSNDLSVLLGNGDGTFRDHISLNAGEGTFFVTAADFDGDSIPDLASLNGSSNDLFVFPGNGDGTFRAAQRSDLGEFPQSGAVADFNDDDNLDFVVARGGPDSGAVLLGNGDGSFGQPMSVFHGSGSQAVTTGFYDNDSFMDIAFAEPNGVVILLGTGDGSFPGFDRYPESSLVSSVANADLNGDGLRDIVTAPAGSQSLTVLFAEQDGSFVEQAVETGIFVTALTSVDVNSDGRTDLLTADANRDSLNVHLQTVTGTFVTQADLDVGDGPKSVAAADFDGNGTVDLVSVNERSNDLSLLLQDANGTFTSQQTVPVGVRPQSVTSGDVNGDGLTDVVVSNGESDDLTVLLSVGDGTFQSAPSLTVGRFPTSVAIVDLNADGRLDLVSANSRSDNMSILMGRGDGTFLNEQRIDTSDDPISIAVGDFNDDGVPDIATVHDRTGELSVILGNGDGSFFPRRQFVVGANPRSLVVDDFNGDGLIDVATGNYHSRDVAILFNQGGVKEFAKPRRFAYDPVFSELTSEIDEQGRVTLHEIDPANGNRLSTTRIIGQLDSADNGETDDLVTRFTYTQYGLVDTITDELGRVTDYDFNEFGLNTSITYAAGTEDEAVRRFEFDAAGNRTAMVDENGNRTEYRFDTLNRLTRITEDDPDGDGPLLSPVTQFELDAMGNMVLVVDAQDSTTRNTYDEFGRLLATTDDLGNLTRSEFDPIGNLLAVIDPLRHRTASAYDSRNRLIKSIDADGGVTKFEYDADDNMTALVDPVMNRTEFRYDARSRLVEETDPLGNSTHYVYDAVDNLVRKIDRNERITDFIYDDVDRLVTEIWLNADGTEANRIDYDYDKRSNLLSVVDRFSSLTYSYDRRDRMQSVDNGGTPGAPRVLLEYTYDDVGNVLSVREIIEGVAAGVTRYAYDSLNRMIRVTQSGNGVAEKRVDFVYNSISQFDRIDRFSDLAGSQLVVSTVYEYDDINRLISMHHNDADGNALALYEYEFDFASRITAVSDIEGRTEFEYDDRDQLTRASRAEADVRGDEEYSFDANGNRLRSHIHGNAYVTGASNRLLSDGTSEYEYSPEGNLLRKTTIATGSSREFEYDHRNKLLTITDMTADTSVTQVVQNTYDAVGRRIAKSVERVGEGPTRVESEFYIYDRENVLLDYTVPNEQATHQPGFRYLFGPFADQVLAQEDANVKQSQWLLRDQQRTIRAIIDDAGLILNQIQFDSFGKVTDLLDKGIRTRFLFTGREFDSDTQLYYYRTRFYDANIGRFILEDVIGFAGRDMNLYAYVSNRVTDVIDPDGRRGRPTNSSRKVENSSDELDGFISEIMDLLEEERRRREEGNGDCGQGGTGTSVRGESRGGRG